MSTSDGGAGRRRRPRASSDDQTFADVLNSFSFDSGRRNRKPRHEREPEPRPAEAPTTPVDRLESTQPAAPAASPEPAAASPEPAAAAPEGGDPAAIVRAYAWTGGRTRSNYDFAIETLVETGKRVDRSAAVTRPEYRAVADLCGRPTSVAEVAALLSIPLGVAKVLLGDMADLGLIVVHEPATPDGYAPDMALMERVLSGLRRL